ncbi:MAG: hypothetical protein PUE15_02410 [Prevotella sp.]|nr:hypothetical protein [Prevotella sp.]
MKTEENKRMLALSCIVAYLKAENMELLKRMQNISAEFADVLCRLNEKEKRMNEVSSTQTLVELRDMRERCDKLEVENRELKRFAKAMHAFVKEKNIYMRKGTSCEYKQGNPPVCSTACLECNSCLGVIEGHGVICEKRLAEACAVFPSYG